MPDFSQFDRLRMTEESTAVYRLHQLEGEPTLTVAPALEANAPYLNALLKQSKDSNRRLQALGASPAALEASREDARVLFARHVIRGWNGVVDSKGAPVEFSEQNCLAFLRALPAWIFDAIQSFCTRPTNFIKPGEAGPKEIEATAGN